MTVSAKHSLSVNAEKCIRKRVILGQKLNVTECNEESQKPIMICITVNLGDRTESLARMPAILKQH